MKNKAVLAAIGFMLVSEWGRGSPVPDRFESWDVHVRAHCSLRFSRKEISSAVLLNQLAGANDPMILAFPDSPPLLSPDPDAIKRQAVLLNLTTGEERIIDLMPPFENLDIECAVLDETSRKIYVLNSGSGRTRRDVVTGYSMLVEDVLRASRVPCRSFDLNLPPDVVRNGRFIDMEAVFLMDHHMYLIDKPVNADDPQVVSVSICELESGQATVRFAGVLPLRAADGMPIMDWITDASLYQGKDGAPELYLLGYNGVYRARVVASTQSILFESGGWKVVLTFPEGFVAKQTMLSEALVITGPDQGYVIKESGRNARGDVMISPGFAFSDGKFVHSGF